MKASVKLVRTGAETVEGWQKYYMTYRGCPPEVKSHFIWIPGAQGELLEDIFKDMLESQLVEARALGEPPYG